MGERILASEPTQTCRLCGRVEVVRHDGRGFPPDIAKRRLQKACKAAGCTCDPVYRAGFNIRLRTAEQAPDHEEFWDEDEELTT